MGKAHRIMILAALFLLSAVYADCQTAWYHRYGILTENILDLFINEASGESALRSISDLSDPGRRRTQDEYTDLLFESKYITDKLNEYKLSDVTTERLGKIKVWHPLMGLLTELGPEKSVIADFEVNPFVLHPVSAPVDAEGELVYIGDASPSIIDTMDLSGKIVLTSSRPDRLIQIFLQKEVLGVVSFYSRHFLTDPKILDDRKVDNLNRDYKSKLFIFNITPVEGYNLRSRLRGGEKIVLHAAVKYRTEEIDLQVPTCIIEGTDPEAGEIIITAHLFEGYGTQGANDNISGSAAILETARMLNKLIAEEKIPRPLRTIRFLWVPEYSGTIPWVNKHSEQMRMALCNINLDMVGLALSRYKSYFVLHRSSYGNAHYVNDVVENYFRYVSENNQANSVASEERFFKPIIAPTGSYDPFYCQIESSSGGSDHDVFNDWGVGVPGVLMITWPDPFYHTSLDRVEAIDPTQLKRVAFISAASAFTIANASENEAAAIAGEVYGNAVRRLGYQISLAGDEINKADADTLKDMLKTSIARIKGTAIGESMTLNTISELSPSDKSLTDIIDGMSKSLMDMAEAASQSMTRQTARLAAVFGMDPIDINRTRAERIAATEIPKYIENRRGKGYDVLRKKLDELPSDVLMQYPKGFSDLIYEEAGRCINGKNSILDIKYLLDAQRDDVTEIEDLVNLFRRMEVAGLIKIQR